MRLLLVLTLLVLSACGETERRATTTSLATSEPAPVPTDASAGPSGIDTMTWKFDRDGRDDQGRGRPRLMYASNGSEGMALNLQCDAGGVYAHLWRGGPAPDLWPFTLRSGDMRADLRGATSGESEVIVRAALARDHAVLTAFRDTGRLSETDEGRTIVLDAINDAERETIRSFFAACP